MRNSLVRLARTQNGRADEQIAQWHSTLLWLRMPLHNGVATDAKCSQGQSTSNFMLVHAMHWAGDTTLTAAQQVDQLQQIVQENYILLSMTGLSSFSSPEDSSAE